jgi:hypothetical protein
MLFKMKIRSLLLILFILQAIPLTLNATDLATDYLRGPWCFTHSMSGNERIEENRNLIFNDDGTFSYQQSVNNQELTDGFTYEILPGKLKLRPIFPGELQVKSATAEELVLNYFVDVHFRRGACQ